jgi:hypothetical protein
MPLPSGREGWLGLAADAAAELRAGNIEPAEAARIAREAWLELDQSDVLAPLAGLADGWDELADAGFALRADVEAARVVDGRIGG